MVFWLLRRLFRLRRSVRLGGSNFLIFQTVALTGMLSIVVADLFSDFVRFEIRFWLLGFFLVLDDLIATQIPSDSSQPRLGVRGETVSSG